MTKKRWTAAWTATLSVSIPIDAGNPQTAADAKADLELWTTRLCSDHPGAKIKIVRAGFGKMEQTTKAPEPNGEAKGLDNVVVGAGEAAPVTELPAHMDRRVPRHESAA